MRWVQGVTDGPTIVPTWLPGWLAGGLGAGVGLGATFKAMQWITEFIAGRLDRHIDRNDKRAAVLDEATDKIIKALQTQLDQLSKRVDDQDAEISELRAELRECHEKHAAAEAKVRLLEATFQGLGDARNMVQRDVSAAALTSKP